MESNESELTDLFKNILRGMNKASRKLVEESAATRRSLIISIDGECKMNCVRS